MLNHQALAERQASVGGEAGLAAVILIPTGAFLGGFYGMRTFGASSVVLGFVGGAVGAYIGFAVGLAGALTYARFTD
jgi:hypothetical protein